MRYGSIRPDEAIINMSFALGSTDPADLAYAEYAAAVYEFEASNLDMDFGNHYVGAADEAKEQAWDAYNKICPSSIPYDY